LADAVWSDRPAAFNASAILATRLCSTLSGGSIFDEQLSRKAGSKKSLITNPKHPQRVHPNRAGQSPAARMAQ
jgi:hypothetical protein